MLKPFLLIVAMLTRVALSFWSAHGIDVAPYGFFQVLLFTVSTVIAGYVAVKGFSANVWTRCAGAAVFVYLAGLFYLLMIY